MIIKKEKSITLPKRGIWRGVYRKTAPILREDSFVYTAENVRLSKTGTFRVRDGYALISTAPASGFGYDMAISRGYDEVGVEYERIISAHGGTISVSDDIVSPTFTNSYNQSNSENTLYSFSPLGFATLGVKYIDPSDIVSNGWENNSVIRMDSVAYIDETDIRRSINNATAATSFTSQAELLYMNVIEELYTGGYQAKNFRSRHFMFDPTITSNCRFWTSGNDDVVSVHDFSSSDKNVKSYHLFVQRFSNTNDETDALTVGLGAKKVPTFRYFSSSNDGKFSINEYELLYKIDSSTTNFWDNYPVTLEEFMAATGQTLSVINQPPLAKSSVNFNNRQWYANVLVSREQPESDDFKIDSAEYRTTLPKQLSEKGSTVDSSATYDGYILGCCYVYADGKESKLVTSTIGTIYYSIGGSEGDRVSYIVFPIPLSSDVVERRLYRSNSVGGTTLYRLSGKLIELDEFGLFDNFILTTLNSIDTNSPTRLSDNSDGKYSEYYEFKNAVFWSDVNCPTSVPSGNREDFGSPAEGINAIFGYGQNIYVFKDSETWVARLTGNTYPIAYKKRITDVYGCLDKNSVIEVNGVIYFLSQNTFCKIVNDYVYPIGQQELDDLITECLDTNFKSCYSVYNDDTEELWFTVCNSGMTGNGRTFVYNIRLDGWTYYSHAWISMDKYPDTNIKAIEYSATPGAFDEDIQVNKDLTDTAIDWKIDTGFLGQDNPFAEKVVRSVSINAKDIEIDFQYDTEGAENANTGTTLSDTASDSESIDFVIQMDSAGKSRYPKIRLSGETDVSETEVPEITSISVRYQERMQDAKS